MRFKPQRQHQRTILKKIEQGVLCFWKSRE